MTHPINKIIIFFEIPFNDRFFGLFGIETFIKNGFNVEVWDFSSFLYGEFEDQEKLTMHPSKFEYLKFSKRIEIEHALSGLANTDFVNCFIGFSYKTFFIYRKLSKKNINYSIALFNPIPVSNERGMNKSEKVPYLKKIVVLKKTTIMTHLVNLIIRKYYKLFGVKPASLSILGGAASMDVNQFPIDVTTQQLWAHSLDYDIFLQNPPSGSKPDRDYAVFLDDFLPFHPDFKMAREKAPTSPEEYYPKLCNFFRYLEVTNGIDVIIAAHPRSTYDTLPDYFKGRPVVRGETAKLVRDCHFVLVHASTSINFAIIYKKPVIFLTMNAFHCSGGTSRIGEIIDNMAYLLHKTPQNLDDSPSIDLEKEMVLETTEYEMYKNNYIKKQGSKELEMWQILTDYIIDNY